MSDISDEDGMLSHARTRLYDEFTKWQANLLSRHPALQDHIRCIDPDALEGTIIPLPSLFNEHTRLSLGISELACAELTLRRGQAHDALEKLRMAIREYNYKAKFKRNHVRGQHANTRAGSVLQGIKQDKNQAVELYRRAYSALLRLGLASDDESLRPLLDNQLFMKDPTKPAELGDNRKEDPWFWQTERVCSSGIEDQEWAVESKIIFVLEHAMLSGISG